MSRKPFLAGYIDNNLTLDRANRYIHSLREEYTSEIESIIDFPLSLMGQHVATDKQKRISAAISGYPTWRESNILEISKERGNAEALIEAYCKFGMSLFDCLADHFIMAIYDHAKQKLIFGIDRIGYQHLYYAKTSDGVIFSSKPRAILSFGKNQAELDPQGLFNYFYFHTVPSPGTIYHGVHKLVNGHYLAYQNGELIEHNYWRPVFKETSDNTTEELSEKMLGKIETAVKKFSNADSVGAFLSGGLDSSTVSGMLSKVSPNGCNTFSIGFDVDGYDEMEYARIASRHFNTNQHEYYVTPDDVVNMVPKIAGVFDEPFGNSSALPAYFCAKFARDNGVVRLLAGDGGDEIFAGNERYVQQNIFNYYHNLPLFVRQILLDPLLSIHVLQRLPITRKVISYIKLAKTPLPDRLENYNFLHRHSAKEIFTQEFIDTINERLPLTLLRETYKAPHEATDMNRMLYLDWKRTLHDNDLVKVNSMCELAGVEVVYPLLTDDIVGFSLTLPSAIKIKNGKLRWFYKEAVKGFLPNEIINKTKHGFGLPFGIWLRDHAALRDLAYDNVTALKKRNIVNSRFIEQAIAMHKEGHAGYYGELIWLMMMLELWLSKNSQSH